VKQVKGGAGGGCELAEGFGDDEDQVSEFGGTPPAIERDCRKGEEEAGMGGEEKHCGV
jgi:hypothetical protein